MKLMLVCSNKEFNNNVIIQFGSKQPVDYTDTITLPLTLKSMVYICALPYKHSNFASIDISTYNLSSIQIRLLGYAYDGMHFSFAMGKGTPYFYIVIGF